MAHPLALELYMLIIKQVDNTTDLLSLALCCSAFRHEAQRWIFRYVDAKSLHRQTKFTAAINASPMRLGPLVHALEFTPPLRELNMKKPAWKVHLSLALRAMFNLKHLAIEWADPSTVLKDCTFELQTLHCGQLSYKSQISFLFCNFLPTHPSIKRLQFIHNVPFDVAEVPTDLCPNLDFLGVSHNSFLTALLRDTRLITQFEWYSMRFPAMTIPQLNHLQYLLFNIDTLDMDTSFTLNLTSLVHLELHIRLGIPDMLYEKLQFLQNIPLLEVLVFRINTMYLYSPRTRGKNYDEYHLHSAFTSAYQHAFELRPTLKYIDVGQFDHQIYNRVFRSGHGENGILVSDRLVHVREVREWRFFV